MKKINKFIIPFGLFILWGYLTVQYIFNYNLSLSVISYPSDKNDFINYNTNRLFASQKIAGRFQAEENYLGIVSVNFTTFGNKPAYANEDILAFRIRQSGEKSWYYEQTYKSGLMYDVPFYPFGFPKIANSKGKTYEFEIESLNGSDLNAISLSRWEPVMVTRYQLLKEGLLKDRAQLVEFFKRKLLVAFGNRDVQFFSLVYLLPLIFYFLLFIYPFKKLIFSLLNFVFKKLDWLIKRFFKKIGSRLERVPAFQKLMRTAAFKILARIFRTLAKWIICLKGFSSRHMDLILILVVLVDIFFIPVVNNVAFIVIIALWIMLSRRYGYTSRQSFLVGLIFLALCPLILLFKLDNIAEKSGAWTYLFFVAGAIQALIEL